MDWISDIWNNKILINGIVAWACAQILKAILYAAINKKFELSRLFGDGGMPSGHSATVTALAASSAYQFGFSSFQFAVTAILAIIVMHDAMGIRLEAGKQARHLNRLTDFINSMGGELSPQEKLKEFVGHTPLQVFAGSLIGLLVAIVSG